MELSKRALGLSIGLTWGLTIMLATWWLLVDGSGGMTISKLSNFYIGYSYSWGGAVIGFLWGFVDGFIGGVVIAWLYNFFSKKIYKDRPST
ncbi:MAG: bacteriophage holin [Ignavibacteria bacterium]|jgi:hypothetical protein